MRVMRAWHICPKWDVALGAAAKCGSTMLAQFVADNGLRRLPAPDARQGRECWSVIPPGYRRFQIVRHPVDRFASLYANVQQRKREPMNFYKQLEGLSPAAFLDKLLTLSPGLTYEFHFQPQKLITPPRLDAAVRLEDFARFVAIGWPDAIPPKVLNESKPVEIDDATAARVCELYADDLRLWEGAWRSSIDSSDATPNQ